MRTRWTQPAAHDFTQICDYIETHGSSPTAHRVALSIHERIGSLAEFPERGRPGRVQVHENLYSPNCHILPSAD